MRKQISDCDRTNFIERPCSLPANISNNAVVNAKDDEFNDILLNQKITILKIVLINFKK